jgi:hypothetical protein
MTYLCAVHEKSKLAGTLSKIISTVFHPLFVPSMILAYLVLFSPNVFFGFPLEVKKWWLITVSYITITFPLITVLLLWRLKFIESIHMNGLKERYAPLIASMLFYFWVFWLFHKQFQAPVVIQTWLLGTFLTTVMVFMSSIFFKISMHSAAWGSVVSFAILCTALYVDRSLVLLFASLLLAGLIGSMRLYLQAHTNRQLWAGYIAGLVAIPLAYGVVLLIS